MTDLTEKTTAEHASFKGAESAMEQSAADSVTTKKLLRKCDLHLLPPSWSFTFSPLWTGLTLVCGTVSFSLLRTNELMKTLLLLGNAKIQGMTETLNMNGNDYNMALFVFFIPVCTLP